MFIVSTIDILLERHFMSKEHILLDIKTFFITSTKEKKSFMQKEKKNCEKLVLGSLKIYTAQNYFYLKFA